MRAISTQESSAGSQKQKRAALNGFSLFAMRRLLAKHVACLNGERKTDRESNRDGGGNGQRVLVQQEHHEQGGKQVDPG